MIFRRIVLCSLLVGFFVGSLATLVQEWSVTPIILSAESFEEAGGHHHHGGAHHEGHHSAGHVPTQVSWAPASGSERTFYTWLSNFLAAIGFSVLLLSMMSLLKLTRNLQVTPIRGIIWGICGFVAFFAVPSVGLPPEIPGVEAAPILNRQLWWLMSVMCTLLSLFSLFFLPMKYKAISLLWVVLPFLGFVPEHPEVLFAHSDSVAVQALTNLHLSFFKATSVSNFLFWSSLGLGCAWALNSRVHRGLMVQKDDSNTFAGSKA